MPCTTGGGRRREGDGRCPTESGRTEVKSALVTGVSRGIGRGIAFSLAGQGYGLTVTSRSDTDLTSLAVELRAAGAPRVVYQAADMADDDAVSLLPALHAEVFETMTALIVNAGVGSAGPVATYSQPRLDKTMAVNFAAPFRLIKESIPMLRSWASSSDAGAKIVALSSITGVYAESGLAAYGASKAALLSLIETVNQEESGGGVTAAAVAPAFVDTDMSAWATDTVPVETMIPVRDVVAVVEMLLALWRTSAISRVVMTRAGTRGTGA